MLRAFAVLCCFFAADSAKEESLFDAGGYRCETKKEKAEGRTLAEWARIATEAKADRTREQAALAVLHALEFHVESTAPPTKQLLTDAELKQCRAAALAFIDSKTDQVATYGFWMLGDVGDASCRTALVKATKGPKAKLAVNAIIKAKLADDSCIPALSALALEEEDAIKALGEVGTPAAKKALEKLRTAAAKRPELVAKIDAALDAIEFKK